MDLRHLACILDIGSKAAADLDDPALSHTLTFMAEAAIGYQLAEEAAANINDPTGTNGPALREEARGDWNIGRDFETIAERFR